MFSLSYDAQRGEVTRPRPHSRTRVLADSKARVHRLVNRLFRKGQNSGEIGCVCVVFLEWCQEVGMALKILKRQGRGPVTEADVSGVLGQPGGSSDPHPTIGHPRASPQITQVELIQGPGYTDEAPAQTRGFPSNQVCAGMLSRSVVSDSLGPPGL